MFSKITTFALTASSLVASARASAALAPVDKRDICLPGSPTTVFVSTNVVSYPVVINQYFEDNTILNFGGVTININNAPTYLETVITATSTVTSFSTETATTTTTATVAPTTFVIAVVAEAPPAARAAKHRRFIDEGYVSFTEGAGTVVASRDEAALFTTSNGQLFVGDYYVGLSSEELTTGYGAFELYETVPDISTAFTVSPGSAMTFTNDEFAFSSTAQFCETLDNSLFSQYTTTTPFSCTAVLLIPESTVPISSTSTTADPSGDLSISEPTATPTPARKFVRKSIPAGEMRRGGLFRSPMHKN